MKYVYVILLVLCCLGCKSTKVAPETSTYEGVLKVQGITTYQYGTHTLTNENDVYALTSDTIILDDFDSEYVEITAKRVDGYPVENGPIYLNVKTIKIKNQ
ncbi:MULTISPECIES: hypothetical protein [Croceibacter]|jgi:hypothetical protein|uniref:Uncharacterized protein n=1 Tax=Croceibacter atlanticus (strain ATCC BAA-628 / JCM 21780 / CIP 108009 / IAM 15332 / KCTC 12090 / HTCC2559) TaxID=216432 RepID=A3U5Y6_CROAH|nr:MULTISPECIES: hypothetical protein [Croceibacter]EAP87653.1 hypothetical protein CA2559_02820 [Croceibacter atlanticus HTCC2559]MBG26115.1 hypothetical protein [Croceibacter sp.]MBW4970113.1 hypothetical protein [Croceibacter atlanticus]WSP35325.1 hypothetical protein VVL01_04460 [Croceibacter atlanticus]